MLKLKKHAPLSNLPKNANFSKPLDMCDLIPLLLVENRQTPQTLSDRQKCSCSKHQTFTVDVYGFHFDGRVSFVVVCDAARAESLKQ